VDVRGQYFQAAIQVIESNETEIPSKVSAVKSIQRSVFLSSLKRFYTDLPRLSFAEYISDTELAVVPRIIRDLGPVLLETSEDTLPRDSVALTGALLDVWPKNIKGVFCHTFHGVDRADALGRPDLLVSTVLNNILFSIVSAKASGVYEAAVKEVLPRLTASIGNYNSNESWVASSALELIGSLARGAPTGLCKGIFAAIARTVFDCMRVAEDRDVLHVGICSNSPVPSCLTRAA
jgi:hypothetical protein